AVSSHGFSCRQLPSDSTSRWTPLLLASGWRLHTPAVDLHHQVGYHAAHNNKSPRFRKGFHFACAEEQIRTATPVGRHPLKMVRLPISPLPQELSGAKVR